MGYHFPFLSKFSDFFPDYQAITPFHEKLISHIFQTTFDESIQFREKVQRYLGDVMKYVDHVLKNAGPPDLLRYVELDHCYMRNSETRKRHIRFFYFKPRRTCKTEGIPTQWHKGVTGAPVLDFLFFFPKNVKFSLRNTLFHSLLYHYVAFQQLVRSEWTPNGRLEALLFLVQETFKTL